MRYKRLFFLSFLFPLGAICMSVGIPLFVGRIIGSLSTPNADPYQYLPHLIIVASVGLVSNRIGFKCMLRVQSQVMYDLQEQAMTTLYSRSVGFHNNNVGGKLVSDAADFSIAYMNLSNSVVGNIFPFLLVLFIGTGVVFVESPWLGLIVLLMAIFTFVSGIYDSHHRSSWRKKRLKAGKDVTGHIADSILNLQTVKTFATEEQELQEHRRLATILRDLRWRDWGTAATTGNNRIAMLLLLQICFVLVFVRLVRQDPTLLGIGVFALSFTTTIFNRLFETYAMVRQVEEAFLQAAPMTEIINETPEVRDAPNAQQLTHSRGAIDFNGVTFAYEDASTKHVFSDLELHIQPGEHIGLVGPSGGGKSTLTRLLLRFEDIKGGSIAIDNQEIHGVTQSSLRKAISYVPQEPLLFHRTIRENIAYGQPDATNKDVARAAKAAYANDFIQELPKAYDTIVGERGIKLSGGQRQRIAIARAILKDAPILILDEATSALDSESEKLIQEALWKLMEGKTALVIAHRLSTIQRMDRIIVLDQGAIIEQGSHQKLLKNDGLYAKLWAHQSGGFIED
jgi:ATP-binding cassette subfamily B protein